MTLSPTSRQVVLQEVFDEGSVPTDEEICDYATRIGIDIENEPHLLYLARDGLMQALPQGWKPCFDKDKKEIYYFNFKTKKTQWEHPLDEVYRNLVKKVRVENVTLSEQIDDDSRTSIKEDLKSFEEASLIMNEMFRPKKLEPLSPLEKIVPKKPISCLNHAKKTNSKNLIKNGILKSPLQIEEEKLNKKFENEDPKKKIFFEETEVRKRPNSSDIRNRRNIGPMEFRHLGKQEIMSNPLEKFYFLTDAKKVIDNKFVESPNTEQKGTENNIGAKDEGYGTEFSISSLGEKDFVSKKELTLTGGGSIFLKSNKMKSSPSSDLVTSSFSKEELSDGLLSPDVKKSGSDMDSGPKSILREQNNQKLNEKTASIFVDKKQKEDVDDERKSVRFNLEKELKITFELPKVTDSDAEESLSNSFQKGVSKKIENKPSVLKEKEESKQIEIDFDDLDIDFSEDKLDTVEKGVVKIATDVPKTAEPKKFKSSQTLVKEFREIFENKSKSDIKLIEVNKIENVNNSDLKTSLSDSSKSVSSQIEDNVSNSSQANKLLNAKENKSGHLEDLIPVKEAKKSEIQYFEDELKTKDFDSVFDELVEFAIKKKLDIDTSKDEIAKGKISYREKEFLLDEILKGSDSDSLNESEGDKLFLPDGKELEYLEKLESHINLKTRKRKELEDEFLNFDILKNEKLNKLEEEHSKWLEDIEETYKNKKKEASDTLREKYEIWLKDKEKEVESLYLEKFNEETQTRFKELRNDFLKKEDLEVAKLKSQLDSEQKERLNNFKKEIEIEEEKELNNLRKNFEESLNEKKNELLKKHKEEIEKIEKNLEDLLSEQKAQKLKELELVRENEAVVEVMRLEMKESYQKQKNNLMNEHELLLENLRKEHALIEEQLKVEFKNEEEALKKSHLNRLEEIKMRIDTTESKKALESNVTPRTEMTEARVCERVRCEKRLLEDKYNTLKEKYIRLKTEAKSTLERKKKKKELNGTATTGSETEKSSSLKPNRKIESTENDSLSDSKNQEFDKKLKLKKQINNLDYLYQNVSTEDEENLMSPKNLPKFKRNSESISKQLKSDEKNSKFSLKNEKSREDSSVREKKREGTETKKRRQLFARFKAASTSKINSNNKNNHGKEDLSPVENLRRQLKKLEELEDQFPLTTYTDTYMRYPFTDNPQFGSSEIEFFKHRIHLERESIRRAKASLKAQKKSFENKQKELKQKLIEGEPGASNIVNQIYQEEKELTDMEVSVHRTRALLGEKIIRLRHLEQSLKRISHPSKKEIFSVKGKDFLGRLGVRNKDEDRTLSDLSSYSGSSGFSSTDFNDVGGRKKSTALEQNRAHFQNSMQESSEIIKSLENLNSEIREIWEVLKKQHQSGKGSITMLPPPPLIYGDLGWRTFTLSPSLPYRNTIISSASNYQRSVAQQFKTQVTGNSNLEHLSAITIDSSLIDRTKSLRDWLKAARNSAPSDAISPSQVTF